MRESSVYIIIPVFNRWSFTKRCLESIRKQSYKRFITIVVNDGSNDGTAENLSNKYPDVKVITGSGNWWWTRCMYEGVRMARTLGTKNDFVLEMNNDCFLPKDYLKKLINAAKLKPKSIIGSICVRDEKPSEVVEAGVRIDWKTGIVYGVAPAISNKLNYFSKMRFIDKIDALPGKGTLIPFKAFSLAGSLDYKHLPHYIADYEFAIRAKRYGFELLIDTKSILRHHFEATGISTKHTEGLFDYKKAIQIVFGRKSMNNLVDWITFLLIACPKEYLLLNLYMTCWRIIYGLTSFFPFVIFRPLVIPIQKLIIIVYQEIRKISRK